MSSQKDRRMDAALSDGFRRGSFIQFESKPNSCPHAFHAVLQFAVLHRLYCFVFCLWATLDTDTPPPPPPHPCGRDIHRLPSPRAVHVCTVCMCLLLLLFLRGARKSGKFLAQLVPAVSIPRVHVCPWVRGGLKLRCDAAAAVSGRVTSQSLDVESQRTSVSGSDHQRAAAVSAWEEGGDNRIAC